MPELWLPGARVDPGVLAGYARGSTSMQFSVLHYTAGTNSEGIGKRGFFTILMPKSGPPIQYAETNALVWHAGVSPFGTYWNPYGPGCEWERLNGNEALTPDQLTWGRRWLEHLAEWGLPMAHYRGPRYVPGGFRGHVDHRDLCSDRSDGLSDAEWAAMAGGGPGPSPAPGPATVPDEEDTLLIIKRGSSDVAILCGNHKPRKIPSVNDYHGPFAVLDPDAWDAYWSDAIALYNAAVK